MWSIPRVLLFLLSQTAYHSWIRMRAGTDKRKQVSIENSLSILKRQLLDLLLDIQKSQCLSLIEDSLRSFSFDLHADTSHAIAIQDRLYFFASSSEAIANLTGNLAGVFRYDYILLGFHVCELRLRINGETNNTFETRLLAAART